jgi:hypothetical protein
VPTYIIGPELGDGPMEYRPANILRASMILSRSTAADASPSFAVIVSRYN